MASTVIDSVLFRDSFGTPAMRRIFDDRALVTRYVEVEVALAKAEARCGLIPEEAAREIAARANPDAFDFDQLRHETENVGTTLRLQFPMARSLRTPRSASSGPCSRGCRSAASR